MVLYIALESPMEFDDDCKPFLIAGSVDQITEFINILIYTLPCLEIGGCLQFGQGHLCFVFWTKLRLEGIPELHPCGKAQSSGFCLESEHSINE